MGKILTVVFLCVLSAWLAVPSGPAWSWQTPPVAEVSVQPDRIGWQPRVAYDSLHLTLSGPDGFYDQRTFAAGTEVFLSVAGLADGHYTYELTAAPALAPEARKAMQAAALTGDRSIAENLMSQGLLPREPLVQSGSFSVVNGILPTVTEETSPEPVPQAAGDAVNTIDTSCPHIAKCSTCLGDNCPDSPSFGFDTLWFQENNLRIYFNDDSETAGFPARDWRIIINDSTSGGGEYFAIEDATAGRKVFTIEGNAPANSLYVEDYGRVGIKTATPVLELHIKDGDSPGVRLEQDTSSGWTAQTWDMAGNESNFFIRDVTNGSKLPFRIQPGAPSSSIHIRSDGKVGLGTASPAEQLHVVGNAYVSGSLDLGSSRSLKDNIRDLSREEALEAIGLLKPVHYQYKADPSEEHLGFIAEDLPELVSSTSGKTLSPVDVIAVLTKVVQEQQQITLKQQAQIAELTAKIQSLENSRNAE
jgi:hypothetical protein